uniref:RNA-dependent RNA polymerase n=1 Tax=Fox fecal picobirnavirus TaxID=1504556 RepID=A0A0M4B3J2_9VIRU|nr:RNA-dependent RNA polymerase [Fox fecal picobirnavirus]
MGTPKQTINYKLNFVIFRHNEIKLDRYFNLPNPGLRSYFDIVRSGQPEIYRTTFAKGEDVSAVLQEWKPKVDTLSERWPTLVEFENDLAKKVGPMSVMKPLSQRMNDIDHYYEDILLSSTPIDHSAVAAVIGEWSRARGVTLRSQSRTVELMKKSTNSGSPYFTKRRKVADDTDLVGYLLKVLKSFRNYLVPYGILVPYLVGVGKKGDHHKEDVKQRVVWMFPFSVNINELQVYQPLIEAAQRFNLVPAWVSMEAVDKRITDLFDTKSPNDLVVCTDFSKFDQHFNAKLQDAALQVLRAIVTPGVTSKEWFDKVYPIKYMIPLAYDVGRVRFGKHGMGSGSGGTNCDETLAHRALQYEAAQSSGVKLNPNSQCLGDDGVLTYPGITVEDVVKAYTSHGVEMNLGKQYASTQDCTYLRRWHHKDYRVDGICVGVYSTCRALGRLRYLERYQNPKYWDAKAVALRQLSILENVKYHPLKEQFAEFCMKRDKYRLGVDIPGFLANIESEAEQAMDLMPDFLGYTKTLQTEGDPGPDGISNWWWIVKYLKSKA